MAGSSFETDLVEMESALLSINGLVSDNFGGTGAGLSQMPFQDGAASDIQQADIAGQIKRAEEADGGNTTFYGQNFLEADTLNQAHGTLLESLLELRTSVEQGIQTLQQNLQETHQTYTGAEQDINLKMSTIAPMALPAASSSRQASPAGAQSSSAKPSSS